MCPLSARNPLPPHELSVVVDLGGRLPLDAAVESQFVVLPPVQPEVPPEVGQGADPDLGDQLLEQGLVEPLQLPPPAGVVRSPVDDPDALLRAEPFEVPGDEAGPVVDVHRPRPPPVPEGPPEGVHNLPATVGAVGPAPHHVA